MKVIELKTIHLGFFKEEIEAARKYNDAAVKYFGEFALLNHIDASVQANLRRTV